MMSYSQLNHAELTTLLHRKDADHEQEKANHDTTKADHDATKRELAQKTSECEVLARQLAQLQHTMDTISANMNLPTQPNSLALHNDSALRPSPRILALKKDRDLSRFRMDAYKDEVKKLKQENADLAARVNGNSTTIINKYYYGGNHTFTFNGPVHNHYPNAAQAPAQMPTEPEVVSEEDAGFTVEEVVVEDESMGA